MKLLKHFFVIFGMSMLLASHITLYYIFMLAYDTGYEIQIRINDYNEAKLEWFLLIFTIPMIIYTFVFMFNKLIESQNKNRLENG